MILSQGGSSTSQTYSQQDTLFISLKEHLDDLKPGWIYYID